MKGRGERLCKEEQGEGRGEKRGNRKGGQDIRPKEKGDRGEAKRGRGGGRKNKTRDL